MPAIPTLHEPWLSMAHAAGGVGELAKALRVGNMTLWRWAHWRQTPHPLIQTAVNAWAQERGIDGPFSDEQATRPHPSTRDPIATTRNENEHEQQF
jgi:hypothetical protein